VATHDYVIANGSGAAVRSDLNDALAAIVSNNSNATEPATTYAYMWWSDTTTGLLKIRNAANTAWVTVGTLASTNLGLLASAGTLTAALGSASTPGITFTGDLNTGIYSPGADQVAISTGGTGRVFVDSSGRVGLASSSPTAQLEIGGSIDLGTTRAAYLRYPASSANPGRTAFEITANQAGVEKAVFKVDGAGSIVGNTFEGTVFRNSSGTEIARFDTSGNLLVNKTTATANGGVLQVSNGITFPATQVACSDANTLDDYEEGTWTPTQGTGVTVVGTFSSVGSYVKIGKQVSFAGYITATTSVAFNPASGTLVAGGLPFSVAAGIGSGTGCNTSIATVISVVPSGSGISGGASIAATSVIYFAGTYPT
jgi:hypothetical protein